jgi:hypothetical protein
MDMSSKLGNPDLYEVNQPDVDTRQRISPMVFRDGSRGIVSNGIPSDACHLVLFNTYHCVTVKEPFQS